ncbi:MAG: hypothetical protein V7607_2766, partial [Solirubrobacteraceae bacterium]
SAAIGPVVLDLVGDAGLIGLAALVAVVIGGAIVEGRRLRRKRRA